jgi:NAD(P)-dependent dehydrogenase (short-subunit alcohol dehydrogenase family)
MGRFDGKGILITGAASGIGRATAQRFASEGGHVYGVDVNEAGLKETGALIAQAGGKFDFGVHDLMQHDACFDAVTAGVETLGGLNALCNVAGASKMTNFADMPEEHWNFMIGINLSAVAFMSQAAVPHLLETQGAIVNVASVAGMIGQAYTVAYCAAKGGVVQLTKAMAAEYIKRDIRINAVSPGGVKTPMNQSFEFPEDCDFKLVQRYAGWRGLCEPEEIASAIAYLASDEARYVNGSVLSIDGGIAAT